MEIYLFFVFLLFFNLSYATYKLPEGTNCDHFCQSNSSVIPNEITGIYYMTEMVPFPFDVGINCGYLNISEPVDGLQYFEEIVKKDGETRFAFGYFKFSGGKFEIIYTDLKVPLGGEIISINPDVIALVLCKDCGFFTKVDLAVSVYVYSRVAVPKCEDIGPVMESLYNCGIPPEAFTVMDYSKCLRC